MKKISVLFAFLFFPFFMSASSVQGMIITPRSDEKSVTVGEDRVIDDDLFIAADEVFFQGTVNGDLFAAGGSLIIRGTINGDILAVGGNIDISATVEDDLRLAGGNIRVDESTIGDSLTFLAGNVTIDDETVIGGGLQFVGGSVDSRADTVRGISGAGGTVNLEGYVGKDLLLAAGMITLGSDARVGGDLIYSSREKPRLMGDATVSGEVKDYAQMFPRLPEDIDTKAVKQAARGVFQAVAFGFQVWSYLSALLVGVLLIRFFPKHAKSIAETIEKKVFPSLGWGTLVFILAGPVFLLALSTVIAVPLALIAAALYLIDIYLAKIFVAMALGSWLQKVLKQQAGDYLSFILGLALFYILKSVPLLGFFTSLIGLFTGLGALVLYKKSIWAKKS